MAYQYMTIGVLDGKWWSNPPTTLTMPSGATFKEWENEGWQRILFQQNERGWSTLMRKEMK